MDSYSYNSYARYYDKTFPSDFQKRCNESAALREDYKKDFERRFPDAKPECPETKPLHVVPLPVVPLPVVPFPNEKSIDPELDTDTILCPNIN